MYTLWKLTALRTYRINVHRQKLLLNNSFPYLPDNVMTFISILLSSLKLVISILFLPVMLLLILKYNHFIVAIPICLKIWTLIQSKKTFENTTGKNQANNNLFYTSRKKFLLQILKYIDFQTLVVLFILIFIFGIKALLLKNIYSILSLIFIIYLIIILFSKNNFALVLIPITLNFVLLIFLKDFLSEIIWNNILNFKIFIQQNSNLRLNYFAMFRIFVLSTISIDCVVHIITNLYNQVIKNHLTKLSWTKNKKIKLFNESVVQYRNFLKTLSISEYISSFIPIPLIFVMTLIFITDYPQKQILFPLFLGIIGCATNARTIFRNPYFFQYFKNKKERQLNTNSFFKIYLEKVILLLYKNQFFMVYSTILYVLVLHGNIHLENIFALTSVLLISIILPLSEKGIIIYNYADIADDYADLDGGITILAFIFGLLTLCFVIIGISFTNTPFNPNILVLNYLIIFLVLSGLRTYLNNKFQVVA